MFATIAPRYDLANRVLSLRVDTWWRRLVARLLLASPGLVLDLASGTGDLSIELNREGKHEVISADFTFDMLLAGRKKLAPFRHSLHQLSADGMLLPFRDDIFDGAAIAFGIRNFEDPLAGLGELARVVRPGGVVGVLEFSAPSPLIRFFYRPYFHHVLPRLGGVLTGSRASYEYLTRSVGEFPEGVAFVDLMTRAGLIEVQAKRLTGGIATFYRGEKPCPHD